MAVKIAGVQPDSPAAAAGIQAGDTLVSINGHAIVDVLDYRFYETERRLELLLRDAAGQARALSIHKGQYESIGLDFETYLMDKEHACANKCVFCFIDQLPKGLRPSLYFKDDDARLSFLFGNYVTLTNMSEREIDRICQMHISPINISVHTTNPALRVQMMGNARAGKVLAYLPKLAAGGIQMNLQVVLCRGLNDGAELARTLADLGALLPAVQSIALVPLGVTKFREGLYPLTPYDRDSARAVVRMVEAFGERFLRAHGKRVCYAADEFYLEAELPIPEPAFYGDFDQLENGVGMMASMRQEFGFGLENCTPGGDPPRHISIATGTAAAAFMRTLVAQLRAPFPRLRCDVHAVLNDFFGHSITVAGLVTGGDLIRQLKGKDLGQELLIPSCMLRHEGDLFLDDVSLEQAQAALGVPVRTVPNDGYELFLAVTGREEDV